MKFVIHSSWGTYHIPRIVIERFDDNKISYSNGWDDSFEIRTNSIFVDYVEKSRDSEYRIITVPDNYTDYKVVDYDGMETLIYIIDGKIYEA